MHEIFATKLPIWTLLCTSIYYTKWYLCSWRSQYGFTLKMHKVICGSAKEFEDSKKQCRFSISINFSTWSLCLIKNFFQQEAFVNLSHFFTLPPKEKLKFSEWFHLDLIPDNGRQMTLTCAEVVTEAEIYFKL